MKVTIIGGPLSDEVRKKAYQYILRAYRKQILQENLKKCSPDGRETKLFKE